MPDHVNESNQVGDSPVGSLDDLNQLVNRVYKELRQVAAQLLQGERPGHTLQPTALVHEAYLRLVQDRALAQRGGRKWLFFAAARAMRQVLVDHARQRNGPRRGGSWTREPLEAALAFYETQKIDVVALDEALHELQRLNERQSRIVELRVFGGYTTQEVAEQLGVSVATVENDFRKARAYLFSKLGPESQP
jgi:RNA polymerase sigma factor (TIGR02999 family)